MSKLYTVPVKGKFCPLCGKETLLAENKSPKPTVYCRDCKLTFLIIVEPKFQENPK